MSSRGRGLGFREFASDIQSIIVSPAERFALICDRRALWGSLLLLIAPAYFGFTFVGGIYFDRDPFPGYSFILPVLVASAFSFLKIFLIHGVAGLLQKGRGKGGGSFSDLLAVFGYTMIPAIIALVVALLVFVAIPAQVGAVFRNFRAITISVVIAAGAALFIWNLILMILALRVVYRIRDLKIVAAVLAGSLLAGIPGVGLALIVAPARADLVYVRPILADKILRFFIADPITNISSQTQVTVQVDLLRYKLEAPQRFELVAYSAPDPSGSKESGETDEENSSGFSALSMRRRKQVIGRIVGLPGDNVELQKGTLRIGGQLWIEPYLAPGYQTTVSLEPKQLHLSEYLILPEDRRILQARSTDLIIARERISGRMIVDKWPLGWFLFRPAIFLQARPAPPA